MGLRGAGPPKCRDGVQRVLCWGRCDACYFCSLRCIRLPSLTSMSATRIHDTDNGWKCGDSP